MTKRLTYAPFHYPECYNYFEKQQQAHWLWSEINMSADINDWKLNLTESERNLIGTTLKSFTTLEILVNDYWINTVARKFRHPEIQMMAATFASFEAIHARSYSLLNESLGLEDYSVFLADPATKNKIDNILSQENRTKRDIGLSLAVFSGFTEGINLFSSFAILLNFSRFNKMKGMGQIISFSIRDESLHSEAGCYLFREFIKENPDIWDDEFKRQIYEAARNTIQLEDAFIDQAFAIGPVEGLSPDDLKAFLRFRANAKLQDLGLKTNWRSVDKDAVARITSWFDILSNGIEQQDFFSSRPTAYVRGNVDFSKMWED
jgi:ribonucleoside-diphosphate reductase beta chain